MGNSSRVLLVDDNPLMIKTLADILQANGYQTDCVQSATGALEKCVENHYTVVITDIRMPHMHGVELQEELKRSNPDITIILMTAYSSDQLVQKGMENGARAVLTKPFQIEDLLNLLSTICLE